MWYLLSDWFGLDLKAYLCAVYKGNWRRLGIVRQEIQE